MLFVAGPFVLNRLRQKYEGNYKVVVTGAAIERDQSLIEAER